LALITGLAGQVYAYTPDQQTLIEGMKLSFQLATAHEKAIQGGNVTEFNTLVDTYNAWVQQHFGADAGALLMSKMPATVSSSEAPIKNPLLTQNLSIANPPGGTNYFVTKDPYKAGSDLSKFGKQQARVDLSGGATNIEQISVGEKLNKF
jgi:hypothetical protein